MQFKIRSQRHSQTAILPINYHYLLSALSLLKANLLGNPPKSRLITRKAGIPAETKIMGSMNLSLNVNAEKRFLEILMNCGAGLYNTQGMGNVEGKTKNQQDEPV